MMNKKMRVETMQLNIEDIRHMFEEMHIVPQKKNPLEVLQEIEDLLRKEPEQYVIFIVSTTKPDNDEIEDENKRCF